MKLNRIDLVVNDVPAAAAFFREVLGLAEGVNQEHFAELAVGDMLLRLIASGLEPTGPGQEGSVLHFQVEDVEAALERARRGGAQVLQETGMGGQGAEPARLSGPQGLVIELHRLAAREPGAVAQEGQGPGRDAAITLREITAKTVREICRLSDTLSEQHKRMVAPNAVSIAQAHFSPYAWFRAIYAGEIPVGFIMLYHGPSEDDPEVTEHFLWRLMIAGPHHGKGYGRRALEIVIEDLRSKGVQKLVTSCGQGEGSPEGFYRSLGFVRNGELFGDEIGLILELGDL